MSLKAPLSFLALLAIAILPTMMLAPQQATAGDVLHTGSFKGVYGHRSSGDMKIVREGGELKIIFAKNFVLRDAPDPKLAWGRNGYKRGTIFGKLKNRRGGAQEYTIPADTDLSKYNEFWLWCEKYNVGLAVAKLK